MDEFRMLYCDQIACRVNTFECGAGDSTYDPGQCPGCQVPGLPVPDRRT